jgi:hypothetical protein
MREKVQLALENAPDGWVVDGNYTSKIGSIVQDRSTDVICECRQLPLLRVC